MRRRQPVKKQQSISDRLKNLKRPEMDLDTEFTFGKYRGATLLQVLEIDCEYVEKFITNNTIKVSKEALEKFDKEIANKNFAYKREDFYHKFDDPFNPRSTP